MMGITGCVTGSTENTSAPTENIPTKPTVLHEQDVKVIIGENIVLGKITDELADLGTIKKGIKPLLQLGSPTLMPIS